MSAMKDMQIVIEEVARIALEDDGRMGMIAHELGMERGEMEKVREYLESLLKEENK